MSCNKKCHLIIENEVDKMKNKRILIIICVFLLIALNLVGCNTVENLNPVRKRLATNYNSYWVNEAIGVLENGNLEYIPKIAFIDTGCSLESDHIIYKYNVVSQNEDVEYNSEHGTLIMKEFFNLNRNASVLTIKVSDSEENINENVFAQAINIAVEQKSDIIHISLGTSVDHKVIKEAISRAIEKDIIVIASSGNAGGEKLLYPAAYEGVISVMARDMNNLDIATNSKSKSKRSFSAPGEHIFVDEEYVTGTSIAAIYITNAVSYIKARNVNITYNEIVEILKKSCQYPTEYSYGMINYKKLQNNID